MDKWVERDFGINVEIWSTNADALGLVSDWHVLKFARFQPENALMDQNFLNYKILVMWH